jgi:hypothetical protein
MPQYEISVPGSGTYRIDSPSELTDAQVWQAVQGQISSTAAPPKDKGFLSNIGSLLVEGGKRAIGAAQVSPSVIAGDVGGDKAKVLSEQLSMKPSVQPKELVEAQTAFKDEAEAFEKAKGFTESIGPFGAFLLEFGKQIVTNPKGAVYLTASSAANMAPQVAGMIAGGKTGMLLGPKGAAVGAIGGGFAAGVPLEIGAEFIGRIGEELQKRGMEPTEENVAALLRDKQTVEQAISDARTKGVTTAAVDALMTVGAGKFATGARRSAIDNARKELGEAAGAAQIAKRADELLKARTLTQKVGRGAGAVGIETAGGGISEAAGQLAAYGEVDLEDVGAEMLGELGGSAVSVPAAAYSLGKDKIREQARAEADKILKDEAEAKRVADEAVAEQAPDQPLPTQAIEDQAAELERQQQRQEAAMERARAGGIGGGSEVNQTLLEQARIRKEQQERAAAVEEKAAEAERKKELRAERVRIGSTQYSGDPMMNEVLRSRAIAEFDAANKPKVEAPKAPEYQPTKTIEQTTPIEQPKDFNVLRGVDSRGADFMSAVSERRAKEEAAAAVKTKEAEAQKTQEAAKVDTSRADVDQRVAQVENFLMSPVRKTQQETADYMAGVIPEMQKDFLALLDEDMSQPLTPEQTEALKSQIRQRMRPDFAPEEDVQRTPFKKFLASKGMNKKDVQDIFGANAYRANQQLPGAVRADAPRLDMLAEAAVEAGFLQEEDTEALVQMIKDEFSGDEQVAVDMAEDRAAAEYEAQRENELASRAGAIGLNTKGMKPEQIAARLDRIERKREEKRRQYNRSIDGFADLPTAEQDRIIDMMIDQFGEPQVFDVERAEIEGRVREEEELLQTQTEKELRAKQADIDRLEKENERLSKEAERKAKADEGVGDFVLTGSKRDADQAAARGQMDLTVSKESLGGSEKETLEAKTEKGGWAIDPEEQRVEKELTGKNFMQVAQWTIDNAPNAFYRTIAEKVLMRLREYERKGVEFEFTLHSGAARPIGMKGRAGAVEFTWEKNGSAKNSKMEMHINGAAVIDNQAGYAPGVQYDTILHELLHAAIRTQTRFMPKTDPMYKELMALDDKVITAFNEQSKAKTLPPVMMDYYRRENNILATPDELISWGMTDKGVQDWLDSIKVGEKSVLTKLVELMRKVIGLGKPYESAFEKLVRTTDSLLDVSVDTIEGNMSDAGFSMAKKQGKKEALKPVQQSLFREVSEKKVSGESGATPEDESGKPKPSRQNIFGEPVLGTWSITVDPKMELQDGLIYKLLDKNIDVKRIVEAVKSTGKQIASQWNPYLQEELYHGRTANAALEFQDKEWLPLLKDMEAKGVTIGELEKYLLNRHAEDYNKLMAQRNPDRPEMQDGASSVNTADARKYLADLDADTKAKYEELAARVDGITKGTRQLLADTGYESAKTIKTWEKMFPNYVPLMREEDDFDYNFASFGTGRGFDVRRDFSRSAMGSKRNVVDIIGNVISARNQAIALTEKNRVAQAVYGLALQAPNPDFWLPINPDLAEVRQVQRVKENIAKLMARRSNPNLTDAERESLKSSFDAEYKKLKFAQVKAQKAIEKVRKELVDLGIPEETINTVMQEPEQRILDPKKGQVVKRVNTKLRENDHVLATRIDGEKRYVFFNPKDPRSKRAATALKNLDAQDLGAALGMIAKVTRWMASVNTQYNPIFGPYNFLRDMQSAALQLSTTELAGQQKEVVVNVVPSLKVIYSSLRKRRKGEAATGELADLWKEFQKEGGQTGFRDNFSRTQDRTEALLNEMSKITEGKAKAGARAVFDWLSDYNDSLENAVRLSAYKIAKKKFADEGFSDSEVKQKAASLAKNLTVNFNRKGDVATQMGALYAFFNASMQGTARMIETLKGPTGRKIMAGGLLLGSMQAALLAAAGFDDEEPPEFIRSKNIVIPTGDGNYIAFPMPLGYHVIPGISRILTEWTLSGFKDTARRVTDLTGLFLDAFNPVGNAGWSVQTVTPTFLDPFVALGENKDWTGKPISKEDMFSLRPTPGYTRAREGANWLSTNLAEFLNYASGGTKYQPGVLSPTPEQIEYLVGQVFGGVGREAIKLTTSIEKTATGEDLPPYKIPLYGRFVGETKSSAAESNKFYKNMERLNRLDLEVKGRREDREPIGDFMRENPETRLLPLANKTYKDVQALRKRRAALLEKDAPKESIQAVEKMITRRMQVLNDRVRAMEQ